MSVFLLLCLQMLLEIGLTGESFSAAGVGTLVSLYLLVSFVHMHVKVTQLLEGFIAPIPRTLVGFFLRVNSKVVAELAKTAEYLVTFRAVVKQTLIEVVVLVGLLLLLELVNLEVVGIGHVSFIINCLWVELTSVHFLHLPSGLNLVKLCDMFNKLRRQCSL